MGKKLIALLVNLSILIYLAIFLLYLNHSVKNGSTCCFNFDFKPSSNLMGKVWQNLALFLGIYMFICVVSVALTRVNTAKIIPYIGDQPRLAVVLNRIISNTIEQSIIFGSLLYAASSTNLLGWPETYYSHLARIFIFGRTFFGVGYLIGDLVNFPYLRGFGFSLTFFASGTLLLGFLGINIFSLSSNLPSLEL